jgi:phosphoglycerate dehydrogenase-like enzyme
MSADVTRTTAMRAAVLDDYQGVALSLADWGSLPKEVDVEIFRDHVADREELVSRLRPFEILVAMRERTPFPAELLECLPNLRLLVTTGMRNAAIDVSAARHLGILVCGTGGSFASTPELAWALILALVRNVPREDAAVRAGGWQQSLGIELEGKTLGLLGLGRIGARVARIGAAFGMELVAWSQNLTVERAAEHSTTLVTRDELFATADVLTIHLVLSERTLGIVGSRELLLMKPTAYLVNTSRGPIVDEEALVAALQSGKLAGAAIDVFEVEPLPHDHPFRRLPNTVVTPHVGYVTTETYRVFYDEAVEDIAAFLRGQPVRVVESQAGTSSSSSGSFLGRERN